jgi:hypothetical protein
MSVTVSDVTGITGVSDASEKTSADTVAVGNRIASSGIK